MAVIQNGLALQYVLQQTPQICALAVQQTNLASKFVKEQTQKIMRDTICA